ncbi:MAG: polyprenyl synthetase family protein [Clostridia bacterium]|nr:polyprenyl synthetase family protein [Clostridia bacterium]
MEKQIQRYIDEIEENLAKLNPKTDNLQSSIYDAMNYSLLSGGKRLRPILLLEFCRLCSGSYKASMPFACAVEMIHTYSLIHDDLPAMDNDDLRRGKPTNHVKFGEARAILAGDALLTKAFEIAASAECDCRRQIRAIAALAAAAGADGMVGGQIVDIESENKEIPIEVLKYMHSLKTGALIKAACEMGGILGGADEDTLNIIRSFADNLGIAFQIRDDILDVLGDEQLLGKPVGSDEKSNKNTYVSLLGLEKSKKLCSDFTEKALAALEELHGDTELLEYITGILAKRNV